MILLGHWSRVEASDLESRRLLRDKGSVIFYNFFALLKNYFVNSLYRIGKHQDFSRNYFMSERKPNRRYNIEGLIIRAAPLSSVIEESLDHFFLKSSSIFFAFSFFGFSSRDFS